MQRLLTFNDPQTKLLRTERGGWGMFGNSEGDTTTWQNAVTDLQKKLKMAFESLDTSGQKEENVAWITKVLALTPSRIRSLGIQDDDEKHIRTYTFGSS